MTFRARREKLRAILTGTRCIRPGSVYDAISMRIAADLGFELGMFGGSVASLAVLGDPDVALITLTELAEQVRRAPVSTPGLGRPRASRSPSGSRVGGAASPPPAVWRTRSGAQRIRRSEPGLRARRDTATTIRVQQAVPKA